MDEQRTKFETWMRDVYFGGISECSAWDEKRNCYLDLVDHMAWKGWNAALIETSAPLGKLRHLYENLLNGGVRDTASAKRIATGLLGPAIEQLEQLAAQPKRETKE